MTSSAQDALDPRWFLPFFVAMWCGISGLLSWIGGWHALARKYKSRKESSGKRFSFVSMGLGRGFGPVSYRSCLFVRIDPVGLSISVFPLFRLLHPRLYIPWNDVADCRKERFFFVPCTALYVAEPKVRMLFYGRIAKELYELRSKES